MPEIEEIKEQYEDALLDKKNVHAVGIGLDDDGNEAVIITVEEGTAESLSLPQELENTNTRVVEGEEFTIEVVSQIAEPQAGRKEKNRPVVSGVSVGHVDVTAGTVSYVLTDGSTQYTASNNHVYANINKGEEGDTIIQPGSADGGTVDDQSATLAGYVPVEDGTTVDVAWASQEVEHTNELVTVGMPRGEPERPEVGDVVVKSGRTTGVTTGEVRQVSVSVDVNFGDAGVITMKDQFITTDMSDPGDSGSAVLFEETHLPAGLLFAGSSRATVMNYATNVESETGLEIVTGEGTRRPVATVNLILEKKDNGEPDLGNIKAVISDPNANAVPNAQVSIRGETGDSKSAGDNGVAVFKDVPIGDYTITADKDGYESASITISEDQFS
jgi:hypothetical protein